MDLTKLNVITLQITNLHLLDIYYSEIMFLVNGKIIKLKMGVRISCDYMSKQEKSVLF